MFGVRAMALALVVCVVQGGCNKSEPSPFKSDDARWRRIQTAAKPSLAVGAVGSVDSVDALLALAKQRGGLSLTCATPAPAGTNQVVRAALARAATPDSPELHAVIYLARLLRRNGSGLVSLMLGSYVARQVVAWAKRNKVTAIATEPLSAAAEQRALAADAVCAWQRYQAGAQPKGGAVLRGYLETVASERNEAALREHQRRAVVYLGDYPALATAPRGYDKYLAKARANRAAFNALVKARR